MDEKTKDALKFNTLLGLGTLVEWELLKSMTQSKTLTIMVCVGGVTFGGFILFLMYTQALKYAFSSDLGIYVRRFSLS